MGRKLTQEEASKKNHEAFEENVELISKYKNKLTEVILKCNDCGHVWNVKPHNVMYLGQGINKHHCPNCYENKILTPIIKLKCDYCGKYFTRRKSNIEETDYHYCSRKCGNIHKNILRVKDVIKDYRYTAFQVYEHKCACCGYEEDERILEVHHIDSDRNNNNIENLIILCPNCHRKITLGYYELNIKNQKLIKIK